MSALTATTLLHAAVRAKDAAIAAHDELNAADAKLGDGDTGVMLRRLFETIASAIPENEPDLGLNFQAAAKACSSATGSSLGTLVTIAMMTLTKATRGKIELPWSELGGHLAAVRDQMMARGGAKLGDKTVIDMLDAVVTAIDGKSSASDVVTAARASANGTLEAFRMRPNKIGRARMFTEKSVGLDDPGMLAFKRLLDAVAV